MSERTTKTAAGGRFYGRAGSRVPFLDGPDYLREARIRLCRGCRDRDWKETLRPALAHVRASDARWAIPRPTRKGRIVRPRGRKGGQAG
jgi:hypothetical protein